MSDLGAFFIGAGIAVFGIALGVGIHDGCVALTNGMSSVLERFIDDVLKPLRRELEKNGDHWRKHVEEA